MKVKVTEEGLLIPKEVAERLGSDEVEVFEEPGRLLIVADTASPGLVGVGSDDQEDPILSMGEDPVDDVITDASENHDRYLYTGD
jgi:bifunctional DNA-binding transcriptional regulator/antitoxin component of YhaV-PrlF toxin-antitoxin module